MGLLNDSVDAISQAGQAGADAARTQTEHFLINQATKYGLQEGVGQLAGIGLGYEAHKRKIPPLTPEHSKVTGTTLLHAMKEWHPVYNFTAQSAATPASLGAPTGGYDLSGGGNG